jgi:hypothetical protein
MPDSGRACGAQSQVAAHGVIARHAGYLVRGVKAGRMLLAPLAVFVVGGRFTFRMRLRPNDSYPYSRGTSRDVRVRVG